MSKKLKVSHYEYHWKKFGNFSSFCFSLNSKLWWSLFQMITKLFQMIIKRLFLLKARSLMFRKIQLLLLKLRTLTLVLTHLWLTKWKFKKPLLVLLQLLKLIKKLRKKWIFWTFSSKSPKSKYNTLNDSELSFSNVMPPTLKPSSKPDLHRDDSLISPLSTEFFWIQISTCFAVYGFNTV